MATLDIFYVGIQTEITLISFLQSAFNWKHIKATTDNTKMLFSFGNEMKPNELNNKNYLTKVMITNWIKV